MISGTIHRFQPEIPTAMRRHLSLLITALLALVPAMADAAPLRVFIRGGQKSHAPGAHEHEQFLKDWTALLRERGAEVNGAMDLPSDEELAKTDVIVFYAQEGGTIPPSRWAAFDEYLKRGGGLVVIHTAAVSLQPDHWKTVIGGTWRQGSTKWKEGPMDLYYVDNMEPVAVSGVHPVTRGAANFHLDDEIYYDMEILPEVRVLATSYTPKVREGKQEAEGGKAHIYDIQPQMWTYERTVEGGQKPYRAFVSIPGHLYRTFSLPHYRAVLLRGIAWAGQRPDVDEFTTREELESLPYPEGGPQRPADTLAKLEIHPDFDLTLVASEPLINKPMNFDWDPAGRMWVAETPEYPNGRRGMRPDYRNQEWKDRGGIDFTPGEQERQALDRISILTDTDGDGVMDRKDVFHDGLELVTGLVFYQDGVIVTQAPDILRLRDTDGDGRCDRVEKLYTGLGTFDTHAVINNPRMGWDGWIYATHGYSASDQVRNAKGEAMPPIGSGVVRFLPDGSRIEQYSSKGGNTWGLQVTADNRIMWTQPTSGHLLMQTLLPESVLARGSVGRTPGFHVIEPSGKSYPAVSWEQMAYVQIDFVGSFTAAAGTVIYDGGAWPAEYNGDYFTTEPTINIIHHTRLTPKGSSYTFSRLPGREETEFIRSTDMWWRPIEVRVGPDGAVYIADFYNQAVIHNDTRGPDHNRVNAAVRPDRDHYYGRIWRLHHKSAQKLDVPDLSKATSAELVAALEHPNRPVRKTASRLLVERANGYGGEITGDDIGAVYKTLITSESAEARIAALWTLNGTPDGVRLEALHVAMLDSDAAVRRNAAQVAAIRGGRDDALTVLLDDADGSVRLAALVALGSGEVTDKAARAIVAAWSKLDDNYQRSAAIGAAARNPAASIAAALESGDESLRPLTVRIVSGLTGRDDAEAAARLVIALAAKPDSGDELKRGILDELAGGLKSVPPMTPELKDALSALLKGGAAGNALPLVAKWDTGGELSGEVNALIEKSRQRVADASLGTAERLAAARSLLGVRTADVNGTAVVIAALKDAPQELQVPIIESLADVTGDEVGAGLVGVYPSLPAPSQAAAFNVVLKRADWSRAFLDAVGGGTIDPALLDPASIFRLRTHPEKSVADRANEMLDALNPQAKQKDEIIAALVPEVSKPGNIENGKVLFSVTCATCHVFGSEGKDIGPALTGMGTHGPGELLTAIVDPNREVDPSFYAWNIETKDGQFYSGVIARENPFAVVLRSLVGEQEVRKADIRTRVNTGRSLMPEGFEALGAEVLRDIIAYMVSVDGGKYRTVDLSEAYTVTTERGMFNRQESTGEAVHLARTGMVTVEGIPFHITGPGKNVRGNAVVLKGGPGRDDFSRTLPQRVEAKVGGFRANRLHFLGGVAGWGARQAGKGEPAMKVVVTFADGSTEEFVTHDGVEFADYNAKIDVPGSKDAPGLVRDGQLRWFTLNLKRAGEIDRIALESFANRVAPVTIAITAELAAEATSAPAPESASAPASDGGGTRVLLAGGGSSHDFNKYFNEVDSAILREAGFATTYTEDFRAAAEALSGADVLVLSTNQGSFSGVQFRQALDSFAGAGKGIVLVHPGVWYNWPDWPEYNRTYVAGGSRGHDRIQEFPIEITAPDHPVTKGLPATFRITDELYYVIPDKEGPATEVLATATSPESGRTYPSIWTVSHPTARIVCIAPGHDARAHDRPEWKTLLRNAVSWAARK